MLEASIMVSSNSMKITHSMHRSYTSTRRREGFRSICPFAHLLPTTIRRRGPVRGMLGAWYLLLSALCIVRNLAMDAEVMMRLLEGIMRRLAWSIISRRLPTLLICSGRNLYRLRSSQKRSWASWWKRKRRSRSRSSRRLNRRMKPSLWLMKKRQKYLKVKKLISSLFLLCRCRISLLVSLCLRIKTLAAETNEEEVSRRCW